MICIRCRVLQGADHQLSVSTTTVVTAVAPDDWLFRPLQDPSRTSRDGVYGNDTQPRTTMPQQNFMDNQKNRVAWLVSVKALKYGVQRKTICV